jgi:hypothetical protein
MRSRSGVSTDIVAAQLKHGHGASWQGVLEAPTSLQNLFMLHASSHLLSLTLLSMEPSFAVADSERCKYEVICKFVNYKKNKGINFQRHDAFIMVPRC